MSEDLRGGNFESSDDLEDVGERDVALAALDVAVVATIQALLGTTLSSAIPHSLQLAGLDDRDSTLATDSTQGRVSSSRTSQAATWIWGGGSIRKKSTGS